MILHAPRSIERIVFPPKFNRRHRLRFDGSHPLHELAVRM